MEPVPLLDGAYGTARCLSPECKREKRIFRKESEEAGEDEITLALLTKTTFTGTGEIK